MGILSNDYNGQEPISGTLKTTWIHPNAPICKYYWQSSVSYLL